MSDEREFHSYRNDARYITFRQYVLNVVGNKNRCDELESLVKLFGSSYIDDVAIGKNKSPEFGDFKKNGGIK